MSVIQKEESAIISALEDAWYQLHDSHFFITGGTGFIGKWILGTLQTLNREKSLNLRVSVLSRSPETFLSQNPRFRDDSAFAWIEGDLRTFKAPEQVTHVIHAAADVLKPSSDKLETLSSSFEGTLRIMRMCEEQDVKRLLFTSSGAVYGPQPRDLSQMSETFLGCASLDYDVQNAYGMGKRNSEWIILNSSARTSVSIARCFAFAGPHLDLESPMAYTSILKSLINNATIEISGDGKTVRSYMYAADLTTWLFSLLLRAEHRSIFNVGSDQAITIAELAEIMRRAAGSNVDIRILDPEGLKSKSSRYIPSIEKARKELSLGLETDIAKATKLHLSYLRELSGRGHA